MKTDNFSIYGKLNDNLTVTSYFSREYKEINDDEIIEFYHNKEDVWYGYFFTSRMCYFPLSFQEKRLGLWKWHEKTYNLKFVCSVEIGKDFGTNLSYYGVAEFLVTDFKSVLSIAEKDYINSFVLFSKKQQNLEELLKKYMPNNMQGVNYAKVINSECSKNNDVITIVVGNDGTNINRFSSNNVN